jgi:hypothetical protein
MTTLYWTFGAFIDRTVPDVYRAIEYGHEDIAYQLARLLHYAAKQIGDVGAPREGL